MKNQIPTGAYIIRNGKGPVLTIDGAAFTQQRSWILVSEEDEIKCRDHQIWWVEQLPDTEDDDKEIICSVTNTSSGKALGLGNADGGIGIFRVLGGTVGGKLANYFW